MLIVARHGRTATNAGGRLLGRADPDLDEVGRSQAGALGAAVAESAKPTRVISSPAVRCQATAEAVVSAPGSGITVEADERWLELDYGDWDGRPLGDIGAAVWKRWRADPAFAPPGGESLADLAARVVPALEEVAADAEAGDVVVVSHVSPIKAAVAWALGAGPEVSWRTRLDVASLTRIAISGGQPSLTGFNDTAHLGPRAGL